MKELTCNEIQMVSGARIRPSDWLISGAAGAAFGAACFVVSSFSTAPITAPAAIITGACVAMGFHGANDILREAGL